MPRIGKIRFVNFTYNENRHIYDQTLDFYNGEDTLLNLQNGGGKTVLVQMMMQPIIPQQKLKDRLFKSYFMNAKAPGYIMIEWILDGTTRRVLTGIGIKRVQGSRIDEESNSLRVITFLSEYEGGSNYDIKNIELTTKEKGMVKLIEFDRVVKNLSEAEKEGNKIWLYRWNTPDDKKEYARRLTEYKIHPAEWRNLMVKINEAEAGLNSFFNDCKTNKALIKKWFIPTIEDQLNKNGDFVENIRELIKNHAGQLVKNEDMMKERAISLDFKRKSADIITNLQEYQEQLEHSQKNKGDLGGACLFVETVLTSLASETEETLRRIKQIEEQVKALEYQRLSLEYYATTDDLQRLAGDALRIGEEMEAKKAEAGQLEYRKNLLQCVKLKEELKNLNTRIAKLETELEKETLQQEDISNKINDMKHSLKIKYQERIGQLETVFDNENSRLAEEKARLSKHMDDVAKANQKTAILREQLIGIKSRINAFREARESLRSLYSDFHPVKSMDTGEYDAYSLDALKAGLSCEEEELAKSLLHIREKRQNSKERLLLLEKECRELRDGYPSLAVEKNEKETAYQLFLKEKQGIEKILRSYQLKEETLFDQEKLLLPLHSDKEKYQKLINDLNLENSIYRKQRKQYESGKAFELSADLKKIFDENNIFVEFGHDWLRNLPENKKAKMKLVKDNPFLPYALIVSEKDFELIKDLELDRILSPVIPVIEREKLEKAFLIKGGSHVFAVGGIHFLIAFDDRLLNKNYLKELGDEISDKINKNNEVMEHTQESLNHIAADILKVESFPYSQEDGETLLAEIKAVKEKLAESSSRIAAYEDELLSLKKIDMDDQSRQSELENAKNIFIRKREDILGFIKRCGQYSLDLKDKAEQEDALNRETAFLAAKESDIEKTKNNINDIGIKIAHMAAALEKDKQQYQKYKDARPGEMIEEELESLESRLAAYTLETSGKIQSLQEILEDYGRQRDGKQKEIKSYGIGEEAYIGIEYQEFEDQKLREASCQVAQEIEELAAAKNELQLKAAERTADLKYRKRSLAENCGCSEPLPRGAIKALDYEQEKGLKKAALKDLEKKISRVREQENKLQRVRYTLEEYRGFAVPSAELPGIEGEPEEYVRHLIKEYKKYTALVSECKNTVAAQYAELENEFVPKAEMFKSLFHSILSGERKFQPAHALNAFHRVFMQIDRKLEQFSIDIKKIDDMEKYIIDNTLSYLKNVYDEMNQIDRNSVIDLEGKRCKMLMISLPEADALESLPLKEYLKGTIAGCVDLSKNGKSLDGLLANEINTYHLFDRFVGVNKVGITLMKIEPNKLKKKAWSQVIAENSGGELFVSAFVVFISLLTYMRGESMLHSQMESKVLIMDNPFGPITSEHLLKPLFEISKKYNTQMICLTDVKGHAIYDRFNLIYSLNIEREVGREDEYIELKTIKKDVSGEEEDEILSASMFKIEDKSRFELAN